MTRTGAGKSPKWLVDLLNKAKDDYGLNQREIARIMGVTQPNIGKYLAGTQEVGVMAVDRLLKHMSIAAPGEESLSVIRERSNVYELHSIRISSSENGGLEVFAFGEKGIQLPLAKGGVDVQLGISGVAKPPRNPVPDPTLYKQE